MQRQGIGRRSSMVRRVALGGVVGVMSVAGSAWAGPRHEPPVTRVADFPADVRTIRVTGQEWMAAVDRVAARSENPRVARQLILHNMRHDAACYAPNLTQAQLDEAMARFMLLPPSMFANGVQPRFFVDSQVWTGNALLGSGSTGRRANLTYSFPDDGVFWGASGIATGTNALNAQLVTTFGSVDRGREYIRQSIASWRRFGGLSYQEVADNNSSMDTSTPRQTVRGDIRIGGFAFGTGSGILAFNLFPTQGGDMTVNLSWFFPSAYSGSGGDFVYLRDTLAHEHGHGLGFIHPVPCDGTKLMEPIVGSLFGLPQVDERRGAGRAYGDRYSGNQSVATARDFGNLTTPLVRSVIERDLSTNGQFGAASSGQDWFRFTIDSPQTITFTAQPTGGVYNNAQQNASLGGCNPSGSIVAINANAAGNLQLSLFDSTGASLVQQAPAAGAGTTPSFTATNLPAGTYTLQVIDQGPSTNQFVQLYDLTVRVGSATALPFPIAGINKRCRAGQPCWFNGFPLSSATEIGAALTTYSWDLDGNGTFEIANNAAPSRTFSANGTHNVTLRVTDTNGRQNTDTITVTVFGASTSLAVVVPEGVQAGQSVPVSILGSNLRGVTSASQLTVNAAGVSFTGTPSVNFGGDTISGLSLTAAPTAVPGTYDLTVTNSDGQGGTATGVGLITIDPASTPQNDECEFAIAWPGTTGAQSFDSTAATDSPDQNFPGTGCAGAITADVFHTWTAPSTGTLTVTAGPTANVRIAMYSSVSCPTIAGNLLGCAENVGTFNTPVTAGTNYLFRIGSSNGSSGPGTVTLAIASTPTTGACCLGVGCTVTTSAACTGAVGTTSNSFKGVGTVCNAPGTPPFTNNTTPCCRADFNQDGVRAPTDIFNFLTNYFAADAGAKATTDTNGNTTAEPTDIFNFLTIYFAGGCP
jgi:hypothetical protein